MSGLLHPPTKTSKKWSRKAGSGKIFITGWMCTLHLPPLRERKDDLPLLVSHFIDLFNEKFGKTIKQFSSSAYELISEYNWPGNIRELENVIEHCFILCSSDIIQTEHLPKSLRENKKFFTRSGKIISVNFFQINFYFL